jgi:hypothetical protein
MSFLKPGETHTAPYPLNLATHVEQFGLLHNVQCIRLDDGEYHPYRERLKFITEGRSVPLEQYIAEPREDCPRFNKCPECPLVLGQTAVQQTDFSPEL